MPTDTSMPPTGESLPKPAPMSEPTDMVPPTDTGAPTDGGSVMMQLPKEAFDAIHQLVIQLAGALDQAAGKVNAEAMASQEVPAPEEAGTEMPPADMASADEQDLANFAQELSNRGR
jgi:hypothetical protein